MKTCSLFIYKLSDKCAYLFDNLVIIPLINNEQRGIPSTPRTTLNQPPLLLMHLPRGRDEREETTPSPRRFAATDIAKYPDRRDCGCSIASPRARAPPHFTWWNASSVSCTPFEPPFGVGCVRGFPPRSRSGVSLLVPLCF